MKIGDLKIETPIILAPMAGVTDYPFRILCKEMGAGIVYSEFVSADGIIRENSKTLGLIRFEESERPIGIQIFGSDPDVMSKASRFVFDSFRPDIIDINYGCPVPKVTKKGAGSAALQ
ncbi:MAG: tRNA-dihydrouridine synthase, partial [Candidatus Marinimicrobia bacterium]|nr:tRNA-dihydrouridine synthase [Candidatus Neomarinimicrobiota bacterium]